MAGEAIDWVTFSGLVIILVIGFVLLLFLILDIPSFIASLPSNRKKITESVVDYLKDQDKKID
ncbi:MAG: hypothetical protein ACTSQK_08035 [Candidatus Heimdallarchaeota archaeon]